MISAWWLVLIPITAGICLFFGSAFAVAKRADQLSEQEYQKLITQKDREA